MSPIVVNLPLLFSFSRIFQIIEGLCYVIISALSIPVYANESMKFQDSDWEYDTRDLYAKILDKAEVFFCIPVLLLTYLAYLILIAMIYGVGCELYF